MQLRLARGRSHPSRLHVSHVGSRTRPYLLVRTASSAGHRGTPTPLFSLRSAAVLGQIFYFRPQTVFVSQLFLHVIAFILGKAWYFVLPKPERGRFWAFLNPGDFNIKEHVAILISAFLVRIRSAMLELTRFDVVSSTATDSALAISVFAVDELYYNITPNYGTAIFTLLGSQLFGYGIAGLMRSVWAAKATARATNQPTQVLHRLPHLYVRSPPARPLRKLTDSPRHHSVFPNVRRSVSSSYSPTNLRDAAYPSCQLVRRPSS